MMLGVASRLDVRDCYEFGLFLSTELVKCTNANAKAEVLHYP